MELRINKLCKTYSNGVRALHDVTLTIRTGMFGLLGPNGAGKSTLMRTIATLQEADSGTAYLGDLNVLQSKTAVREVLGYLPQEFGLYPKVSAQRMLNHFATLKGIGPAQLRREVCDALFERTNLQDVRHRLLGGFSGGMKQRFGIALALLGSPKLIIVDEPTAGLDPEERGRFHNLLSEIAEDVIVILSTHIVSDVSDLCQEFAVLHRGKVVLTGEPIELTRRLNGRVWRRVVDRADVDDCYRRYQVLSKRWLGGRTVIHVLSDDCPDESFEPVPPDLRDVYFWAISKHDDGTVGFCDEVQSV